MLFHALPCSSMLFHVGCPVPCAELTSFNCGCSGRRRRRRRRRGRGRRLPAGRVSRSRGRAREGAGAVARQDAPPSLLSLPLSLPP
eukprot:1715045-Rhodomonas_salina.1